MLQKRDPKRIGRILKLISTIWKENPDFRLGQLLVNLTPKMETIPFYYEDSDLEIELETLLKTKKFRSKKT